MTVEIFWVKLALMLILFCFSFCIKILIKFFETEVCSFVAGYERSLEKLKVNKKLSRLCNTKEMLRA